jgi:serine/threonine-protein kinase
MNHEANDHADREARVNAAIADYLNAVDSGQTPDRAAFLRQHAALAPELEAFLSDEHRLQEQYHTLLPSLPTAPVPNVAGTSDDASARLPSPDTETHDSAEAWPETALTQVGRYRVEEEIARGGMGVVYRAHDPDLGRSLAIKVLQERHQGDSAMVRRFLEEAQVCGQLQHPGVPPIHELGTLLDGRLFFAMKLVKGHTLADLLREREPVGTSCQLSRSSVQVGNLPQQDLPRFLQIFEQVCQTVAYAHSKGILHRDLKPANVMVGAFGEVQVMDWGLAKVIRSANQGGGVGRPGPSKQAPLTSTVFSSRAALPEPATQVGTVLGTLAYMPPEQARGQVDYLDERADVFALGAALCEILTGQPPYTAAEKEERLRQAAMGDLAEARNRLAACRADEESVRLALACLEFEPSKRPRDAGAVAEAVAGYRAGVEERARKAEVERAAAEARAEEAKAKARAERRARRLAVGLAAAVLLTVLAGGGGWLWVMQDRAARERSANLALGKAEQLMDQAENTEPETGVAAEQAVVLWCQAEDLLDQAEGVLASGFGAQAARERLAERRREAEAGLRRAEAVAKLLPALDKARALKSHWRGSHFDYESAAQAYKDAFAAFGLDEFGAEPEAVAAALRKERPAVRRALVVALDDWAFCTREKIRKSRLRLIAGLADDDDWRRRYRAAVAEGDLGELKRLAERARAQGLPAVSLELLAVALRERGARTEAAVLLRHARGQHPTDFWIHFELGNSLHDPPHPDQATVDEAVGCFWAAVALRPVSPPAHINLGLALQAKGRLDEANAEWLKAIDLDPTLATAHNNLGVALEDKGKVDEAIVEYDVAIELDPKLAVAHSNHGNALYAKGRLDEAIAEQQMAIDLDPKLALAHNNLGFALQAKGQLDKAIAEYHKAINLDPKLAQAHNNLGRALRLNGRLDEAIAEWHKALDLNPRLVDAHTNLGLVLRIRGQVDQAIAECHKAIDLDPKLAQAHTYLGLALRVKGLVDEAIAEGRKAIDLDPKLAEAHTTLAAALHDKGRLDEAIAEYQMAIDLDPKDAPARGAMGQALLQKGRFAAARDATCGALNLLPQRDPLRGLATYQLQACERLVALDNKLPAILKGDAQPADNQERLQLADMCVQFKKRYAPAVRFFTDAFAADPKLADDLNAQHRYNAACAAARAGTGQGNDANIDSKERTRLRKQALTWLRADLTAWDKLLDKQLDQARPAVLKAMQHWQDDADLARVRGDPLAKLPETERNEWRKLWDDVETQRQRAAPRPELVPTPKEEP